MSNNGLMVSRYVLRRSTGRKVQAPEEAPAVPPLPVLPRTGLIGGGGSGSEVTLREVELIQRSGNDVWYALIDNDINPPPDRVFRGPDGTPRFLSGSANRFILNGEGSPRDAVKASPLLRERYADDSRLLRGISVYETYNQSGHGGSGLPVVGAMDLDLSVEPLIAFLREKLRPLSPRSGDRLTPARTQLERVLREQARHAQQPVSERLQLRLTAGGSGTAGFIVLIVGAYLIRWTLAQMGVSAELIGVVLGPHAFTGLTRHIRPNYQALAYTLDYLARRGLHRTFAHGLTLDLSVPPVDQLFLFDDPTLPADGRRVTERELNNFYDRCALTAHMLFNTRAWADVMTDTADENLTSVTGAPGSVPWLHTARAAAAHLDRQGLFELAAQRVQARLLEALVARLAE